MCPLSASPPEFSRIKFDEQNRIRRILEACFHKFLFSVLLGECPRPRKLRFRGSSNASLNNSTVKYSLLDFLRKEVIQPHLPIRLPCYDFTPVTGPTFDSSLLAVGSLASGVSDSHGVTGGVYKTRERIHRDILIRDY